MKRVSVGTQFASEMPGKELYSQMADFIYLFINS